MEFLISALSEHYACSESTDSWFVTISNGFPFRADLLWEELFVLPCLNFSFSFLIYNYFDKLCSTNAEPRLGLNSFVELGRKSSSLLFLSGKLGVSPLDG